MLHGSLASLEFLRLLEMDLGERGFRAPAQDEYTPCEGYDAAITMQKTPDALTQWMCCAAIVQLFQVLVLWAQRRNSEGHRTM